MATRQDKQITDDLIRYVNIMNDIIDVSALHLRAKNEETGEKLQVTDDIEGAVPRDMTTEELVAQVKREAQNALGYSNSINTFIVNFGVVNVEKALTATGYVFTDIQTDVEAMKQEALYLSVNVGSLKDKAGFETLASHIDANIPKLTLVRRTWCLGAK